MSTVTTSRMDVALEYATEHGWRVVPIPPGQKYPRHKGWPDKATTDVDQIGVWWKRFPNDGIGIACGEVSDLVVIDVDVNDGKVGARTLADLEDKHGPLPETYTVQTGAGGWHHYFRWDPAQATDNTDLGLDVNVRAGGGQVLAPPTIHPDTGTAYRVHLDVPLADLPDWIHAQQESYAIERGGSPTTPATPATTTSSGKAVGAADYDGQPGTDYNARHTWAELLTADGWKPVDKKPDHWTRPPIASDPTDKTGTSATVNYTGTDRLKVFTTSIPALPTNGTHSKFEYYAFMHHGGDFKGAAAALGALGYGNDRAMNHRHDKAPTGPEVALVRPDAEGADGFHLTDTGNAGRLAHHHGGHLRFIPRWKQWLAWDGKRWQIDYGGTMATRYAGSIADTIWELVPGLTNDDRKRHVRHATNSESRRAIADAVKLAEAPLAASHDDLDVDPWALNVGNGILNLRTGKLRPHDPAAMMTKLAPVDYDPQATAPTWHRFMERILPDPEVRNFVQRAVGYSLTGSTAEQVLIVAHGDGANGKSTLLRIIGAMLGDYATVAPDDLLVQTRHDPHPTGIATLHGARFVSAVETEAGARLAEAQVKLLTGGDPLTARRMREDFWTFNPTHKLWLGANHRPRIVGEDHAIWRRIRLVPFTETIPDAEQDPHLADKLTGELPGILAWAVAGCLDWQTNGLTAPAAVVAAVNEYRRDEDWLLRFFEDRDLAFGEGSIFNAELMDRYRLWCSETRETPLGGRAFAAKLEARGAQRFRHASHRGWRGIYAL